MRARRAASALARRMAVSEALEQQRYRAYNRTTLLAGVAEAASAVATTSRDSGRSRCATS